MGTEKLKEIVYNIMAVLNSERLLTENGNGWRYPLKFVQIMIYSSILFLKMIVFQTSCIIISYYC